MKINPFRLERWLLEKSEYDLGGGGVIKLQLKNITTDIDYNQLMKYGRTDGSKALKSKVAEWYGGIDIDNILITSATSEANLLVNYTLLERGDDYFTEYPQYEQTSGFVKSLGINVKPWNLLEEKDWKPDLENLKENVTKKTKIIFLDNPNNPTGALLSNKEMKGICEIAEDVGAYVHCDNALRGSELDGKPTVTPFEIYEKGVITGSISKLGVTTPRIGWVIGDKELIKRCWILKDYTTLSHSGLGENLAEIILSKRETYIKRNLAISSANIQTLSKWIEENKDFISWVPPKSSFTAFPKYYKPIGSTELCKRFLKEEKVLLSPGDFFGVDQHLRINTGSKNDVLVKVLHKLEKFMNRMPS